MSAKIENNNWFNQWFLGEYYKPWLQDYEQLMAYRKTIKGKPTDEQRFNLEQNKLWIAFYKKVLFGEESTTK